jgi:hypothetical protein
MAIRRLEAFPAHADFVSSNQTLSCEVSSQPAARQGKLRRRRRISCERMSADGWNYSAACVNGVRAAGSSRVQQLGGD